MGGQPDPESNPNQLGLLQPDPNPDLTRTGLLGGQVDPICKPNPAQPARLGGQADPESNPTFNLIGWASWEGRLSNLVGLLTPTLISTLLGHTFRAQEAILRLLSQPPPPWEGSLPLTLTFIPIMTGWASLGGRPDPDPDPNSNQTGLGAGQSNPAADPNRSNRAALWQGSLTLA